MGWPPAAEHDRSDPVLVLITHSDELASRLLPELAQTHYVRRCLPNQLKGLAEGPDVIVLDERLGLDVDAFLGLVFDRLGGPKPVLLLGAPDTLRRQAPPPTVCELVRHPVDLTELTWRLQQMQQRQQEFKSAHHQCEVQKKILHRQQELLSDRRERLHQLQELNGLLQKGKQLLEPDEQGELIQIGERVREIVHDLLNPLAGIQGLAEMIRSVSGTVDETTEEWARLILSETDRIRGMSEDLLDFARGRPVELQREAVELGRMLVEEIVPTLQAQLAGQGLKVESKVPKHPPLRALVDRDRLLRVLSNLARNAAQATGEGGRLVLSLSAEGGRVVLRIADNGPGIPAAAREAIFSPEVQGTQGRGRLGLGLNIARRLVQEHGGTLELGLPGVGEGAVFLLCLPLLSDGLRIAG